MRILTNFRHLLKMEPYDDQSKFLLRFFVVYRYVTRKAKAVKRKKPESYPVGDRVYGIEEMLHVLEKEIKSNLGRSTPDKQTDKTHLLTPRHSEKAHGLIGQKTLSLALIVRYRETGDQRYLSLLKEVLDYCLVYQEKAGVFRYHNPVGLPQDEGPVTAGLIQAFCQAYQLTTDERYLKAAIKAAEGSLKLLFLQEYGFLHTRFHEIETTNVNSSFALAFYNLYEVTNDSRWLEWGQRCTEYAVKMQSLDGAFMYTNKMQSIYKASYHFLVLLSLISIQNKYKTSTQFQQSVAKARLFAKSLIRTDGSVAEDVMAVYSWAPSCARAMLYASTIEDKKLLKVLTVNMSKHFSGEGRVFLDNKNNMLSDDSRADLRVLSIVDMYYDLCRVSPTMRKLETEKVHDSDN